MNIDTDYLFAKTAFTLGVLIANIVLSMIFKNIINLLFSRVNRRIDSERGIARTRTIKHLFKNILDFVLLLISILIILSNWGINILPVLTGAGILGLAISFGAQTFIKDVISGIFIVTEDQYHIGDTIIVGDKEGEVIDITFRLTILKNKDGNYIYIPNSLVTTIVRLTGEPKKVSKKRS